MQYHTFGNKLSQELCVIVMLFGKYKYKHLPMGLKCAPNFAQQVMEEALHNVADTSVYLDNIGAFSFTWEHYILLVDKNFHWLEANGFTVNPLKCEWAIQETDWLVSLAPTDLEPWHKKLMASYNAKTKKSIANVWLCQCCQSLPTNVVSFLLTLTTINPFISILMLPAIKLEPTLFTMINQWLFGHTNSMTPS